jgi:hypothetical protein
VPAAAPTAEATLVAEALRLNARYVEEVVIGWDLCPWAARAWREGQVERRVLPHPRPEARAVAALVEEIAARPRCAIGLAIFPRVDLSVAAWDRFAEDVRRAKGPFLIAAFHPQSRVDAPPTNAAALVSLIRRTPDPTLQLVRASLIDDLARTGRDVSAEIARDNFARVSARDPVALTALLDDLRRDRDRAYGAAAS